MTSLSLFFQVLNRNFSLSFVVLGLEYDFLHLTSIFSHH
jgi:hypothetical protein